MTYKGHKYDFFLYKVTVDGDSETAYLGIAGGYDMGGMKMKPVNDITGIYTGAPYDEKNVTELLKNYLLVKEKEQDED